MSAAARSEPTPLRVAVDAQLYAESGAGGVQSVLIGLVHALGRLTDGPEEYVVISRSDDPDWWSEHTGPNQRIVPRPVPGLVSRARRRARRLFKDPPTVPDPEGFYERLGCHVVHFPYPRFSSTDLPIVYNPHDLQHLHLPQFFAPDAIAERERLYRAGCARATTVAVASDWIKRDIVSKYGLPEQKLQVIPWAPPTEAYEEPGSRATEAVREEYGLPSDFAFYPAMTWPHKNHLRLVEALALLRDRHGLEVPLVCTGNRTAHWSEIEARISALRLQDQVWFLGMVPSATLRSVYSLATLAVLPSCFEAASSPLFEAWQAGLPAAISTVTSLPEQAGDAAVLFDPYDVEAIADAVARLYARSELRADMRERGRIRLGDFSWERTAKKYRAVYRRAAGVALSDEDEWLLKWDWMRDAKARSAV